jgi:hypothetical protein
VVKNKMKRESGGEEGKDGKRKSRRRDSGHEDRSDSRLLVIGAGALPPPPNFLARTATAVVIA